MAVHKETWIKYPGGKSSLAPAILEALGREGPLAEPCVGAGAVLRLALDECPPPVGQLFVADANPAVRALYSDPLDEKRLRTFANMPHSALRAQLNSWMRSPFLRAYVSMQRDVATAFLAYNRRSMNGIVRVNQAGEFNVSEGRRASGSPVALTDNQIASAVRASHAIWRVRPKVFADCVACVAALPPRTRIYLDTPYTGGFVAYTKEGWSTDDDIRTYEAVGRAVRDRQCRLVASAPDTEWYREVASKLLPSPEFREVTEARPVNSDGAGRKPVRALLIVAGCA